MIALRMLGRWNARSSFHRRSIHIGGHVPPLLERGLRRRLRKEGRCMIALRMSGRWEARSSLSSAFHPHGGRVPPLLGG
jgi:hypothetical protein